MDKIIEEINFYDQRLKEAHAKLYKEKRREIKRLQKTQVLDQKITEAYSAYNGDCVEVIKGLPDNSIHYSVFSPPFASLFTYSDSIRDMGNNTGNEFKDHFDYLIPELYRVLMPGRLVSAHVMNIPMTITHDGIMGIKDFRGGVISAFSKHGFIFHSEVCIWKDPLLQAVRTKKLELAHKQIVADSTRCAMGFPDYIVTFRKQGENKEPVTHPNGLEYYIGEEKDDPKERKQEDQAKNKYSHHVWRRYADPVWDDIRQTNTLNVQQAKDERDEKHICPLQLDVIARCLELWTNTGDIVLSPFAGIGSEGYVSLQMKRKFIGIELKDSYYRQMLKYLKQASRIRKGLFNADAKSDESDS